MNPNTNEIASLSSLNESNIRERLQGEIEDFEQLPEELQPAAKKLLKKRKIAIVSKTSGGKLSRWAASKRRKKKQAEKAKRRSNRSF